MRKFNLSLNYYQIAQTLSRINIRKVFYQSSFILGIVLSSSQLIHSQDSTTYKLKLKQESLIFTTDALFLTTAYFINKNQPLISAAEINNLDYLNINRFDRNAVLRFNSSSAKKSDYAQYLAFALPFSLLLGEEGKNEWKDLSVLYLQTYATNAAITAITLAHPE